MTETLPPADPNRMVIIRTLGPRDLRDPGPGERIWPGYEQPQARRPT
jgi:hypothetical protein